MHSLTYKNSLVANPRRVHHIKLHVYHGVIETHYKAYAIEVFLKSIFYYILFVLN